MPRKQPPTVAITGANGFLGTTLKNHFLSKGWHVLAMVRSPAKYAPEPSVRYMAYDLRQPVDKKILRGVDYLVHTAYVKQHSKGDKTFDINVDGAKSLLLASRANKIKKNIFISSMSSHAHAESVYGLQKLYIESLFSEKNDVNLRPGLIIGNGGLVKSLSQFIKSKHMVPVIGGGKQPLQVVSVDNLACVIEKVLLSPISGTFTIAHPKVYAYKDFYKKLVSYLGVKVIFVPIPYHLLLAVIKTAQALRLPLSINQDNLLGLKNLIAVDTRPDIKRIGVTLDNLDDIFKQTILE